MLKEEVHRAFKSGDKQLIIESLNKYWKELKPTDEKFWEVDNSEEKVDVNEKMPF